MWFNKNQHSSGTIKHMISMNRDIPLNSFECFLGKVQPHSWIFVAFVYNSIDNWGTFHVGNTFGYYDTDNDIEHPVSCYNVWYEGRIDHLNALISSTVCKYSNISLKLGGIFYHWWWRLASKTSKYHSNRNWRKRRQYCLAQVSWKCQLFSIVQFCYEWSGIDYEERMFGLATINQSISLSRWL